MANDEQKNVFERAKPPASLADDRKNKFERHQEVIDANRRNTAAHDERVVRREGQRATWTHQADQPHTAGGVVAGTELAALKAVSDASRTAQKQPPVVIHLSV